MLSSKDFAFQIIAPTELVDFTELVTAPILQKMSLVSHAPVGLIKWHLEQMYGSIEEIQDGFMVFNSVSVFLNQKETSKVTLEWNSDPINDMIADSIVAVVLQADNSPASVKATKSEHTHSHGDHNHKTDPDDIPDEPQSVDKEDVKIEDVESEKTTSTLKTKEIKPKDLPKTPPLEDLVHRFLALQFGEERIVNMTVMTETDNEKDRKLVWSVNVDKETATVIIESDGSSWDAECESDDLKKRLLMILTRIMKTYLPLSNTWVLN